MIKIPYELDLTPYTSPSIIENSKREKYNETHPNKKLEK